VIGDGERPAGERDARSPVARLGHRVSRAIDAVREAVAAGRPGFYVVGGVRVVVVNTRPDIATAFVLSRFAAALSLIEQYQPWRLRHLRRDVAQIRIAAYPSRGVYFPGDRTVLTELSFLAREAEFTAAQVASSILHEGVHARIHEMGIHLGFDLSQRDMAREERLCRRAEVAFGGALPEALGLPVVARATDALALTDAEVAPDVDWREAYAAKDRADRAAVDAWRRGSG
jgi:hypothetical protein